YPNAGYRENTEVILVAIVVAMAIRTFFLQPFKIPTGSMQPTLYGITSVNLKENPDFHVLTGWAAFTDWFKGVSHVVLVADHDCTLSQVEEPALFRGVRTGLISLYQTLHFEDGTSST